MHDKLFTGEAGAGLVKVTIDSVGRARHVEIDDLVFKETDKQLISDLFAAALNRAYELADGWLRQQVLDNYKKNLDLLGKDLSPESGDPLDIDITKFFNPNGNGNGNSGRF